MIEGLFWIFISFFAALGILDVFKWIQSFVCRRETHPNILLIPVGDDTDTGAECRIHTAVAESDAVFPNIYVVDVGMQEKNKEICNRLCNLYNLQIITPENLSEMLLKTRLDI